MMQLFARLIMHCAVVLAPSDRVPWARAMQAELAAMRQTGAGFAWALGGLTLAAGWRLRHEAFYLLAVLLVGGVGLPWLLFQGLAFSSDPGRDFLTWMEIFRVSAVLPMAAALSIWKPHRAVLTGIALPLLTEWFALVTMVPAMMAQGLFTWENNNPPWPTWVHLLYFLWIVFWPGLMGAAAGWSVGRILRANGLLKAR